MRYLIFTLLLMLTLFLSNGYTQDWTRWSLPEGAKMRIGKGDIRSLKFSPDGNQLAVATRIGIWIYNMDTGAELALLIGHTAQVQRLAFSPNGKILASTGNDSTLRLWNTQTGEQLTVISERRNLPWSLTFSPDGTMIVSGCQTGIIHAWKIATGNRLITLRGHTDSVEALAFSPNGKILASASEDTSIQFPNPNNATPQESYHQDISIRLWDISAGKHLSALRGHKKPVKVLAFSPDGKILASAGMGGTVRLWNPDTGEQVRSLVQLGLTDTDQEFPVSTQQTAWIDELAFSPDGSTLASGDHHGTVRLWRVNDGKLLSTIKAHTNLVRALAFSRDKPIFMSVDRKGVLHTWSAATGSQLSTLTLSGHVGWGFALGFTASGTTLASVGWVPQNSSVQFWDISGNREFTPVTLPRSGMTNGHAFSPDGEVLAIATGNMNIIELWDLHTSSQYANLAGHTWFIETLVFSPDGNLLASGGREGVIYVWDANTGERKKTLEGHQISVKALAFAPNGKVLASASHRDVRLWNIDAGTLQTILIEEEDSGQSDAVALASSQDGETLASTAGGKIYLWDFNTRRLLSEIKRRSARIKTLAFSPDSAILFVGCADGAIEMWDADTYLLLSTIKPHTERIDTLTFSPDGRTLATGSMDGTILVWDWEQIPQKR